MSVLVYYYLLFSRSFKKLLWHGCAKVSIYSCLPGNLFQRRAVDIHLTPFSVGYSSTSSHLCVGSHTDRISGNRRGYQGTTPSI